MGRPAYLAVLAICLLVVAAPVVGAHQTNGENRQVSSGEPTTENFDRSQVLITVYENGSARWTFQYERTLENETQVQEFEQYAQRFKNQRTDLYTNFQKGARALVSQGNNVTNRSMQATDFSRSAKVTTNLDTNMGVVRLSFTWTNFARTNTTGEHQVIVGDVFDGGLYLAPNQSLVVSPGPNLAFESVTPNATQSNESSLARSDSVTWEGERQFTDQRPRIVFQNASAVTTPKSETSGIEIPGGGGSDSGGISMFLLAVGLLVLLALGGVVLFRQSGDRSNPPPTPPNSDGGAPSAPNGPPNDATTPEAPGFDTIPAGSDSARVIALLRANNGQMRQSDIVDETNWSKSKVSMLLSEMEADGHVRKQRIGRENIISLHNGESAEES